MHYPGQSVLGLAGQEGVNQTRDIILKVIYFCFFSSKVLKYKGNLKFLSGLISIPAKT